MSKFFEHHPFTQEEVSSEGTTPVSELGPSLPPSDSSGSVWVFCRFSSESVEIENILVHMLDVSLSTGWPAVPDTLVVFPGLCATPPSLRPSPSPSRPVCAPARRTTATSLASGTARPQRPTSTSTPLSLSISTWVLSLFGAAFYSDPEFFMLYSLRQLSQ